MAISCAPKRPALPSARMYARGTGLAQAEQTAPVRRTVPSASSLGAAFGSVPTENSTRPSPTRGTTYTSLPLFLPSQNDRINGIVIPQPGLAHLTSRPQLHPIPD